jgi:hypothetical protein
MTMSVCKEMTASEERKAMAEYFKQINSSPESRREFLRQAHIMDKNGNIKKDICILQPAD